jgi:hypothetical protein
MVWNKGDSISSDRWHWGISGFAVGCTVAAAIYISLGIMFYTLIPDESRESIEQIGRTLLIPLVDIRPEPKEKYTYLLLLLSTPVVLLLANAVQRRINTRHGFCDLILLVTLFSAGIYKMTVDPFWQPIIQKFELIRFSLLVSCILLLFGAVTYRKSFRDRLAYPLQFLLYTTIAFIIASWRVFDGHAISSHPIFVIHYDAVSFALMRIVQGGTCLVDVLPQYGCYGEIMAPMVRILGSSTAAVTASFTVLQLAATAAVIGFARRVISNPIVFFAAILWILPATNSIFSPDVDPDFQNMPVRMLFPAISLQLVLLWQAAPTIYRALGLGAFSGLAVVWNLETGTIVAIGLSIMIVLSGCTDLGWTWRAPMRRRCCLAAFVGGLAIVLGIAFLGLSFKSGTWVHVLDYAVFQATFFGSGAYMLPMPGLPSLWSFCILLIVICLLLLVSRFGQGGEPELEAAGYLAIVAAGMFSYFVGRSHPGNLGLVSWPFVVLLFVLGARAWNQMLRRNSMGRLFGAGAVGLSIGFGTLNVVATVPSALGLAREHWMRATGVMPPADFYNQIDFVRKGSFRNQPVALLTTNQASLLAETGVRSATTGTSWVETLRRVDANNLIQQIATSEPDPLFLSYDLCCTGAFDDFTRWVRENMVTIRERYALTGWSDDGAMMRLVPRSRHSGLPDLFSLPSGAPGKDAPNFEIARDPISGLLTTVWRRPVRLPYRSSLTLGANFRIQLRFSLENSQPPYATLLTTHRAAFSGLSIEMNQPGSATMYVGTGDGIWASPAFALSSGDEHMTTLIARSGHMTLIVDGRTVVEDTSISLDPGLASLIIGGYYSNDRQLRGSVIEFKLWDAHIHSEP